MDVLSDITRTSGAATIAKALLVATSGSIADGATSPTGVLGEIRWSTSLQSGQGAPVMWDGSYWRKLTISDQPSGTLALFDFGTSATSLHTGSTRVHSGTTYTSTGNLYGWVSGTVSEVDRSGYSPRTPTAFFGDGILTTFNNGPIVFRYKLPSSPVNVRVYLYDAYSSGSNASVGCTGKTTQTGLGIATGSSLQYADFLNVTAQSGQDYIEISMHTVAGYFFVSPGLEISSNATFSFS